MANKAKIVKSKKEPKFSTRDNNRCQKCGRPRSYMRRFGLCRLCFLKLAKEGKLPGVKKASW